VPLVVWSPIPPANRRHLERLAAWGEAIDVSSAPLLVDGVARLLAEIESQRILWVEGERFLHRIALAPGVTSVSLVE
jgi:hypothetical protein